ncbi:hypothetical protein K1T71_012663 [Dendrolimus kikuchii]|uniref:Uncharacterized protein n=1 Tax=Dendrolimus kikuchii TaxID=765133 RepID=A0ACC1CJY2_9NEOP|nr:hypothetical protein K1T71_012663 [Dendrolimus kikuchii]
MKTYRESTGKMRKYYQLILVVICFISVVTLLIYRHEYYRLRYVLEVLNFFGKPGLSEIEFCGPGFNASLLSEIMRNSSMEVRETPPMFQQIDENFYTYSSFLRSYQKYGQLTQYDAHVIDTIVIGKSNAHPKFRCNIWLVNSDNPKAGRFTLKLVSESSNGYNLYLFQCSLTKNLGTPVGVSFYVNDYNINPIHAPINRVVQVNTKRNIRESSSIKFVNNIELAACVVPNQVPMVSRDGFIEFLAFQHMMGINYFTIYDSMITEDVIKRLNLLPEDITQWNIKFFPLNYPFIFSQSYETVKKAIELDCLFRHFKLDKEEANKASHIVVLSWDEFLVPREHNSIKAVLDDFDPTRKVRTFEITPLMFCLNQNDDDNAEFGYPSIMKKTSYYKLNQNLSPTYVRNLDLMPSFEDIPDLNTSTESVQLEVLGMHKYTECRDPKMYNINGYNETQLQVLPHKFEGAMLRFAQNLLSNKIYGLYRTGKIWEKPHEVREML